MSYYISYNTIDQFTPVTIHSDVAHNTPHNKLINNDVVLDTNLGRVEQITYNQGIAIAALQSAPPPPAVFTKSYNSGDQLITADGTLILVHGLGARPKAVNYTLHCVVAEWGYNVGDYLDAYTGTYTATGGNSVGFASISTSATLSITYSNSTGVFIAIWNAPGLRHVNINLTNASWRLNVAAFA